MMNKLVMDGLELAEPPAELVKDSMYGLMEAVRNYDGSAGPSGIRSTITPTTCGWRKA